MRERFFLGTIINSLGRLLKISGFPLFLFCAVAQSQCPDTGTVLFYRVDQGINGYRLLGKDSYWSFFVGADFHQVKEACSEKFWMDNSLIEWRLIPKSDFLPKRSKLNEEQILDRYFKYESKFLRSTVSKGLTEMEHFEDFAPIWHKGPDGVKRRFKIWKAHLGKRGDKKAQFWIANINTRGAVVFSIVQMDPADAEKTKLMIDSYIANFGSVSEKTCNTLADDFEKRSKE